MTAIRSEEKAATPFTRSEYARRLCRFHEMMVAQDIDAVIVDDLETMIWLTGYGVSANLWRSCIVPLNRDPILVLRSLDVPQARAKSWIADIVPFGDDQDPVEALVHCLLERGLCGARLGIDEDSYCLTPRRFLRLSALLPGGVLIDIGQAKRQLRWVKSAQEISHIGVAAGLTDEAFRIALANARSGARQRDVAGAIAAGFYRLGFDDGLVGPLTAGDGWDCLHGYPSDEELEEGTILHLELVPRLAGYSARLMRSISIGEPRPYHVAAMDVLLEAQDRQLDALRPGARACDVDRIARNAVLASGMRDSYDNVTGYTLGVNPTASPQTSDFSRCFTPAAEWVVEPGMVFHMYLSASGVAISETVVVREELTSRLTQTDRKLFKVG